MSPLMASRRFRSESVGLGAIASRHFRAAKTSSSWKTFLRRADTEVEEVCDFLEAMGDRGRDASEDRTVSFHAVVNSGNTFPARVMIL